MGHAMERASKEMGDSSRAWMTAWHRDRLADLRKALWERPEVGILNNVFPAGQK
jgi:hypothetical protein